jgi:exopolysaccharide production protein ExoQ
LSGRAQESWFSGLGDPRALLSVGHWPYILRERLLLVIVLAAIVTILSVSLMFASDSPLVVFLPLGVVAALLGGGLVYAAWTGSRAAILVYFVVLAFVTDAQFRVRGAGEIDADWQSLLKFGLWIGAGIIGSAHLPPLRQMLRHPGSALWLTYIGIALVSSIYSPAPAYTFGCALALLCFYVFAYTLTRRLTLPQMLWAFVHTFTVFNIISWILFYAVPELGTNAAWTLDGMLDRMCGLAGQATNLGVVCAMYIGAVFLLWWSGHCRVFWAIVYGSLGGATLLASNCRTMIIGVVLGIAAVVLSRSKWLYSMGALAAVIMVALSVIFPSWVDVITSKMSRSGEASEVYTLTGRLEIWDFVWTKIMESPFLGWGYNSSKVILASYFGFENGLMVDSAHNMYLQSLLSVGLLGTLPLVVLLGYLTFKCLAKPSPTLAYFLTLVLIGSVSDTGAVGTTPTVLTLLFILVSIPHEAPLGLLLRRPVLRPLQAAQA